jgi:hypothetical protein
LNDAGSWTKKFLWDKVNILIDADPTVLRDKVSVPVPAAAPVAGEGDEQAGDGGDDGQEEQGVMDYDADDDGSDDEEAQTWQGSLPLHLLVLRFGHFAIFSNHRNEVDILLRMLRDYPEAAVIRNFFGTPYIISVGWSQDDHIQRLLLRAAPHQREFDVMQQEANLEELRRLNWEARRMGMFLSHWAVSTNPEPTIFARLRYSYPDLLQRVISFL